jgi:hypothetical protein
MTVEAPAAHRSTAETLAPAVFESLAVERK